MSLPRYELYNQKAKHEKQSKKGKRKWEQKRTNKQLQQGVLAYLEGVIGGVQLFQGGAGAQGLGKVCEAVG